MRYKRFFRAVAAFWSSAFAALLGVMHARNGSALLSSDPRISVPIFGACALGAAVAGVMLLRRRSEPSRLLLRLIYASAAISTILLPGRIRILRAPVARLGSSATRRAHNAIRELIAAQEDYRVRTGVYARSVADLEDSPLLQPDRSIALSVATAQDSTSWSGVARSGASDEACRITIDNRRQTRLLSNFLEDDVSCGADSSAAPNGSAVHAAVSVASAARADERRTAPPVRNFTDTVRDWSQERRDAAHSGLVESSAPPRAWNRLIAHEIRAVPTVAGGRLVVGAHATGWLGAIDIATGDLLWHTRAPNWIHQNAVIADGLALVGVGDRNRTSPSGVVGLGVGGIGAYDLATGRLRWFAHTPGGLMTAPAVDGRFVMTADGSGELVSRAVTDGSLRWRVHMPGHAVMASPVVSGKSVYVAVIPRTLCAYDTDTGARRWCYDAPTALNIGGDATPSVIGGAVYWSLAMPKSGIRVIMEGGSNARTYLQQRLTGKEAPRGDQWLIAIDAQSGRERWRRLLGGAFESNGNIAGSPIAAGANVIVVAPLAHAIFAVDTTSGLIRWKRGTDAFARGAPTLVDSLLITTDRAAHLHILRARDGDEVCRAALPEETDRSGPIVSGSTVVFAGVRGLVFARPIDLVLHCSTLSLSPGDDASR